jgi:cytochrome c oxidase subunit III
MAHSVSAPTSGNSMEGAHAHAGHDPYLAHHFDTPKQQFEAGKLGIWLFLVTEVLFFSGLFCAYSLYRALHPEIFVYAHYYLDTFWGAFNTCVLIVSSLTAAWAVRNAQLGQRKLLITNICITILCAFGFMGVKYVEYSHKFHENILPGKHFNPTHEVWELPSYQEHHQTAGASHGSAASGAAAHDSGHEGAVKVAPEGALKRPRNASVFFGIYFCMTGLHGIHVLGGIIVWFWILRRAIRGEFNAQHFGAVDYAALYWHLVDLIWIYLFPLLYLIH